MLSRHLRRGTTPNSTLTIKHHLLAQGRFHESKPILELFWTQKQRVGMTCNRDIQSGRDKPVFVLVRFADVDEDGVFLRRFDE